MIFQPEIGNRKLSNDVHIFCKIADFPVRHRHKPNRRLHGSFDFDSVHVEIHFRSAKVPTLAYSFSTRFAYSYHEKSLSCRGRAGDCDSKLGLFLRSRPSWMRAANESGSPVSATK